MAARLTDVARAERAMTELDLQRLIVGTKPPGVAVIFGWEHVHVRPGMRADGRWRTATSGSMAAGWPDLVLVRIRDRGPNRLSERRLIFAELKRELEHPSPDQIRVLEALRGIAWPQCTCNGPLGGSTFGAQFGHDGKLHDSGCALIGGAFSGMATRIEVHVWRPSDLRDPIDQSAIYEVLR